MFGLKYMFLCGVHACYVYSNHSFNYSRQVRGVIPHWLRSIDGIVCKTTAVVQNKQEYTGHYRKRLRKRSQKQFPYIHSNTNNKDRIVEISL